MEKAILLLSGGIDSPVAAHLLKDRLGLVAVHFHQKPLTGEKEIEKVKALVQKLKIPKTYLVPFTLVLKEIIEKCVHRNYFVLSKIMMFKAAEIIAQKEQAQYLITGENLGQVSSQTLSNLTTITKHVSLEIIRPLLTCDKQEIVDLAKKIGTYDLSKGPEICNLLGPKNPATKSDVEIIAKELNKINFNLVTKSLEEAEIVDY